MKMVFGRMFFCRYFYRRFCGRIKKAHHLRIQGAVLLSADISDQDNRWLIRPTSEEEVRHVMFQISPLKAPGPDYRHDISFQKCWNILDNNLIRMVPNFLSY